MMQHENEFEIHLNANGNPDVDYYVEKAYQMRNQAIAAGFRAAKNWMYRVLQDAWSRQEGQKGSNEQVAQSGWPWVDLILETHPRRKTGHI